MEAEAEEPQLRSGLQLPRWVDVGLVLPLVLLPGLGLGCVPYLPLIATLLERNFVAPTYLGRLGEVATAVFASGRANSHDVIRVDLETAMLGTRLVEIERQFAMVYRVEEVEYLPVASVTMRAIG